jgi:hypothetical protein
MLVLAQSTIGAPRSTGPSLRLCSIGCRMICVVLPCGASVGLLARPGAPAQLEFLTLTTIAPTVIGADNGVGRHGGV